MNLSRLALIASLAVSPNLSTANAQQSAFFGAVSPDGRPLIASSQYVGDKPVAPSQHFGWHDRRKIRNFSDPRLGVLLSDIEANMPAEHGYRTSDRVTWAHETIHGISSALRVEVGEGTNGFYIPGRGRAMILREPKFPKALVNQFVPTNLRGGLWATYMDNPKVNAGETGEIRGGARVAGWGSAPLYILDELNAYIGGMEVAAELRARGLPLGEDGQPGVRLQTKDLDHAIEFLGYASALLVAVGRFDPDYPDRERLEGFVSHAIDRTMTLVATIGTPENRSAAAVFAQVYAPRGVAPKMAWRGDSWGRPVATTTAAAKPQAQPPAFATLEDRLTRIERRLEQLSPSSRGGMQ